VNDTETHARVMVWRQPGMQMGGVAGGCGAWIVQPLATARRKPPPGPGVGVVSANSGPPEGDKVSSSRRPAGPQGSRCADLSGPAQRSTLGAPGGTFVHVNLGVVLVWPEDPLATGLAGEPASSEPAASSNCVGAAGLRGEGA
jgi:hypothetical protein